MTLEQAKQLIQSCAKQMHEQYKKSVFDEWAIVSLAEKKGRLLAYLGPRKADFQKNFLADADALRAGLFAQREEPGEYEFARHGIGTKFEAYLVLGRGLFLICNNTEQSMEGITKDPLWLSAQVPFVEMTEKFRQDPLTVKQ